MRTALAAVLIACLPPAASAQATPALDPAALNPALRVYTSASQLAGWCRDEAEARAVGLGHTTYQWTASHSERGNTLNVAGRLHVDGGDFTVTCRIARGARQEYATIDMTLAAR